VAASWMSYYSLLRLQLRHQLSSCWDGRPFVHNRYGPKSGGGLLCLFLWVKADGSWSNTLWPGRGLPLWWHILIHPAVWPQQTWAKMGEAAMPLWGAAGSPSNTMWPVLRPTSILSLSITIHTEVSKVLVQCGPE